MNKLVICLLVAVCLLGFALILLNERMGTEVATPVVSEKIQPVDTETGQTPIVKQNTADKTDQSELSGTEAREKALADRTSQTSSLTPSPRVQTESVNKALDEILSDRAAEVQAPNQQASIVQQSSIADLVVETPQLPKIDEAISIASDPQTIESTVPQPNIVDADENANKRSPGEPDPLKKQDGKIMEVKKKEDSNTDSSKKNDKNVKAAVQKTIEESTDKNKTPTTSKAKTSSVSLFTVFTRENGATVRLRTNTPLPYSVAQLQNPKALVKELQKPDRLMFDLTGTWDIKEPAVPNNVIVNKVRVGKMADRARIVVDLKEKPKKVRVKIAEKKDGLDIFLDR